MPRRYRPRRGRRRRHASARRYGPRNQMVSTRSPIAKRAILKLRYCDDVSIDTTAGAAAGHVFRANSVFDPDLTAAGHQPYGFDEWSNFYNHYTVLGAKITVNYTSESALVGGVTNVGISLQAASAVTTNPTLAKEKGSTSYGILTGLQALGKKTLSKTFSAKKFFGVPNVIDGDRFTSGIAANPSEEAFFVVWVGSVAGADDPNPVNCAVTIEYIVALTEPKTLAQS